MIAGSHAGSPLQRAHGAAHSEPLWQGARAENARPWFGAAPLPWEPNYMGDSRGERAGLARARTGGEAHVAARCEDGAQLLFIHPRQQAERACDEVALVERVVRSVARSSLRRARICGVLRRISRWTAGPPHTLSSRIVDYHVALVTCLLRMAGLA